MIKESCPWTEEHPHRLIKVKEIKSGNLDDYWRKKMMIINRNPVFDPSTKYYSFIKVLKTATSVSHWLIKILGQYYVVAQARRYMGNEDVSIYQTDRKGIYDCLNPIAIYSGMVDIESGADRFAQEMMANLINKRDPRVQFLLDREVEQPITE